MGLCPLRKFLGSKEHLYWLKIDLNAAEIITVEDYKHTKINVNGSTHIQESNSQAGNILVKDIMTTQKDQRPFCRKIQ